MRLLRNRYRWTLLLASALLPVVSAAASASGSASANTSADSRPVLGGAGVSMGVGGDLYLEVLLNGSPTGRLAHFGDRDGKMFASVATLRELGFVLSDATPDPVALDSLTGVVSHYDAAQQQISINAPLGLLNLQTTLLNQPAQSEPPAANTTPGALLNYDVYATLGDHHQGGIDAYTELRAFNAKGVFSTTTLVRGNRGQRSDADIVRMDSSWRMSWPASMLTLALGDTLTSASSWSRPTHIAGVQLSRDFALQPYRITTPIPAFLGAVTTPSAVDLYINGIKQYSGEVAAGPFRLNGAPTITGSGMAQVVLTDALGRATRVDFPFYTTDQLLQKGLSDWSAELGVVRRNYGLKSFDYGHDPVASGTLRYGLSDRFTAAGHAEASKQVSNLGFGGTYLLSTAGVINGSLATSTGEGVHGTQLSLGYHWRDRRFHVGLDSTRTHGDYRDVASQYGIAPPRTSERAVLGFNAGRVGNLSVSYMHLAYAGEEDARYASTFWSRTFGTGIALNLSLNQNINDQRDRNIFLGASIALGNRISASVSAQHSRRGTELSASASQGLPSDTGFGWRAQASNRADGQTSGSAEASYRNSVGQYGAGVSIQGDSHYAYANASGAVVLMGGQLFAARHIDDAFAVVSTDGVANVPVKLENRTIGSTDAHGMLLVTPLNAWQRNQLAIDPMQLPGDMRVGRVKANATPTDRAGTLVRFPIEPVRAASVILVDASGAVLPVGSHVKIAGQHGQGAIVGFDGVVYLDTLKAHNTLDVSTPDGVCHVHFDYHKVDGSIPLIGPLTCTLETQP